MSLQNKGILIQAGLGAVLLTVLMIPFQSLTPLALYSPMLILPVMLFFTLQAPPRALLGMFLSFVGGVAWGAAFLAVQSALPGVPLELVMGIGVACVIFLVLAVHPLVFGRTPLGMVPAVLLGVVETLLVTNLSVLLPDGAPVPNLPWLVVIFGYGCVMTLILVLVQDKIIGALLGAQWRSAPTDEAPSSQIPPTPPVRPSPRPTA
ncbi:hypothetical protein ACWEQV_09830 [Rhodococcus aetherivorans]|uniref:hypothetical protein n=1 Tax=Rhodococcus aetherivorans TaxID=191292 RepID=UPI00045C68AB|nr:hypothetical protein [Rhodococcus aetherivorans]KDE11876.1 hypothetical protein N505_0119850 [Rhodococcus aetherivorans]